MIFAMKNHYDFVLIGFKTQTRRDSHRYQVGKTYAIQECRTCKGHPHKRIKITRKWRESAPYTISWDDAREEGGFTPRKYEELYNKIHPNWNGRWCYKFMIVDGEQ